MQKTAENNANPRTTRSTRTGKKPTVQCRLCGRWYGAITISHLLKHDYTVERYVRTFAAPLAPAASLTSPTTPRPAGGAGILAIRRAEEQAPPRDLPAAVLTELRANPDFIRTLADDVRGLILGPFMRDELRHALASVLTTRMQLHGLAVANLIAARQELAEPWRMTAGGPDGEATPTLHLVAVAGEAHAEVSKTEEALLRTIKLAIEETRVKETASSALAGRPAFTGTAETIPVPPELPAGEREALRNLMGMLRSELEARAARARRPLDALPTGTAVLAVPPATAPGTANSAVPVGRVVDDSLLDF